MKVLTDIWEASATQVETVTQTIVKTHVIYNSERIRSDFKRQISLNFFRSCCYSAICDRNYPGINENFDLILLAIILARLLRCV